MPAPATLPPLTPGWCHAPTRLIDPRSLGARPLSPPIFPHDTRAGLLERLSLDPPDDSHAPDLSPLGPEDPDTSSPPDAPLDNLPAASTPAPPPFVALVEALTAPALLALARRGACGFVLRAEPDRHTLVLARALGLPLALTALPLGTLPSPLRLGGLDPWPGPQLDLRLPASAARVLPLAMLPAAPPAPPWIELISAQPEERHLAARAIRRGRAAGVGLLRLEFVFFDDPGVEPEALCEHLRRLMEALAPAPVAVRLADWSADKPPAAPTPIQAWEGRRGLAGLMEGKGEAAVALQIAAIERAALDARHPEVWIVAPHVESPASLAQLRGHLRGPVRLGAMLETPEGCEAVDGLRPLVDGLWLGLGDLGHRIKYPEQLQQLVDRVGARSATAPLLVCGWPPSTPQPA